MVDESALSVPEHYNFAADCIDHFAEDPKAIALHWVNLAGTEERILSFADVRDASRRFAAGLQAAGFVPGDRVKIVVGRDPAWWICALGMMRAGVVWIPGTTLLTPKDFDMRIGRAAAVGVITDAANAPKVDEIRDRHPALRACVVTDGKRDGWLSLDAILDTDAAPQAVRTRSEDPCVLYFTSGTTGHPKMVVHTHASYPIGHRITGSYWLGLGSGDLHWNLSDNGWAKAAYASLFGPWSQGAGVFVEEAGPRFDAAATLDTLRKHPITSFCGPPTAFRSLIALPDLGDPAPAHLSRVQAAGEPLNPEIFHAWKKATGIEIHEGYGQTESSILVCSHPSFPVKPGSMGKTAPGFDVQVVDADLSVAPANTEGDIAVRVKPERPVGLFVEYENHPEENAEKFRGDWYLTGDRGFRDEEGYFFFIGRSDDVILSAGYRIGPFEVESALIEHEAVLEAAVVGAPHPERYQIVVAFVILHEGFTASDALAAELQDHVKRTTAPYKYPREIEFVSELPKTISGKIRRVELRQRGEERGG
ncbi:MAG: AMP-binding protein [Myxococcales bacterium]|nr:AMP-binding protein [Myxococcales bacterium]